MWANPQEAGEFAIITEEILNNKLHFLYSVYLIKPLISDVH